MRVDDEIERDTPLPAALRRVTRDLRADVSVPPMWRERVLSDVARARRRRRISRYRMPALLAASIMVLAAGVLTVRAAQDGPRDGGAGRGRDVVRFSVVAPAAQHVSLVGDFNVWDPRGVAMHRGADGHTWTVDLPLPPGRHAFVYMVDGRLRADPAAAKAVEDDFGSPSSVVVVADRGTE